MPAPGRAFKIFLILLLGGIFFELLAIIGFLSEDSRGRGDVAVVEVKGPIDEAGPTVKDLKEYAGRKDIKAIVLRVDSPGGAVGASQEIHEAVLAAAKKKVLVASLGDVAGSGGYYVAVPAAKIVADPGTVTGSIGVIAHFFVVEDLLKKAHLRWEVIKAGKVKDIGSPLRSMTAEERRLLEGMTTDIHEQFIAAVAQGRKKPVEEVRKLADGRLFSGRQAKELGLVDELGGLETAIRLAGRMAGIKGEPEAIYPKPERFSWLRRLAEGKVETSSLRIEYRLSP